MDKVERWDVYEISLKGPESCNPFKDVKISAWFKTGHNKICVAGFYDGNGIYKIRFSPDLEGEYGSGQH